MKNLILLPLLFFISIITYSQSGQKWAFNGNSTSTGDFIGTTNAQPLSLRTNGLERFKIDASGNYFFNGLTGTTMALISLNPNGQAFRINFTGNATDVLLGNGTFGSFATMSGWSLQGSTLFTPYSLAIDAPTVPGYKVSINGNVLVGGKLSATSMEVVELVYADTIKGQKALKIRESLCFEGFNAADPNSRNAICAHGNDLFIMSGNNNYNTIFNFGNNGNVGIGTNSPQTKLDINGDMRVSGIIKTGKVYTGHITPLDSILALGDSTIYINLASNFLYPSINTSFKGLGFGQLALVRGLYSSAVGYRVGTNSSADGAIIIGKGTSSSIFYNTIPNSLMVGFNSDRPTLFVSTANGLNTVGNVGIGTSTPLDRFQIGESIEKVSFGSAFNPGMGFGTSYIGFNASRTSTGWTTSGVPNQNGGSIIYGTVLGNIHFVSIPSTQSPNDQANITDQQIRDNTKMMIWSDGRVGVGTSCIPSNQKLAVDGGIICEEVTVKISDAQGCWPDYVFSEEYELTDLDSVANFIKIKKRLPGMPSAAEVDANGLAVSDILIMQTEKIEELTLYLIELSRRLREMEEELKKLKAK